MNFPRSIVPMLAVAALMTACGGTPTDNGGGGGDGPQAPRVILDNPVFSRDIQPIFDRNCTLAGCHGSAMSGRLGLANAAQSYADLVNVPSFNFSNLGLDRVEPNDVLNSYLWVRLVGDAGGRQMPQGAPSLDNIDLTNIMNWINNGALNDLEM